MPTNWNPADISNVTLSGANLVAATTLAGGVRSLLSQTTGKSYWEYVVNTWGTSGSTGFGFGNSSAALNTVGGVPTNACLVYKASGNIYVNNTNVGTVNPSSMVDGALICCAIDLGAKLVWMRNGAAGLWNFNAGHDPATGAGGFNITSITSTATFALAGFGASGTSSQVTANFGGSAFTGAVPSGFTAGFPSVAAAAGAQARAMVLT